MTITEATLAGIARIRRPIWAYPQAYLLIDILPGGYHGPWGRLFERRTQEIIEEPTPQMIMIIGDRTDDYEAYGGELDRDDPSYTNPPDPNL